MAILRIERPDAVRRRLWLALDDFLNTASSTWGVSINATTLRRVVLRAAAKAMEPEPTRIIAVDHATRIDFRIYVDRHLGECALRQRAMTWHHTSTELRAEKAKSCFLTIV